MKIDRLLAIVILLINRRMVQAQELADRFEVSVRTIYRDIDSINTAGIPVITFQGSGGGIGLAEGFRLERHLLTEEDVAAIVAALRSVSTPYADDPYIQKLLGKLTSLLPEESEEFLLKSNQLLIDFVPWGADGILKHKFALLKKAVASCQVVSFTYVDAEGSSTRRRVEPYALVMKGQNWYLYGYCQERCNFRLFKLKRIKELQEDKTSFVRQAVNLSDLSLTEDWRSAADTVNLVLRFNREARYLAEEFFGVEALYEEPQEEYFTVRSSYPEDSWLYSFLLSFGDQMEVLEPAHIRCRIQDMATSMANKYVSSLQT
ncbi:transcriptional regulator [Paenibacillus sp. CAA11]|uniref:helix-turn-helix transcriptional regulator n=1 Tax=Paenibacillus sp. CAA11 TaxID=1532905 RepID=UPI000D37F494|nr:YafY family protein [Paenibacillus sp. CAA11]AWB43869.1 transcriptional regulator [Paenibacillus sp. CAA11]